MEDNARKEAAEAPSADADENGTEADLATPESAQPADQSESAPTSELDTAEDDLDDANLADADVASDDKEELDDETSEADEQTEVDDESIDEEDDELEVASETALTADQAPDAAEDTTEASESDEATADTPTDAAAEAGPVERAEGDADTDTVTLEAPEGQSEVTTERVVEAILFASETPLPLSKIVSILGVGSARDVRGHIQALNEKYERTEASFRIEQIASGYQMLSMPVYNTWIRRLKASKQESRLSQPALETLAVVAYKQPVVRADIEAIRGVSAGEMLNRLRELGLIKIVGRAEDVGRPMLYGTTKRFLEVFGLSGLEDLPAVEELQAGE